MLQPQGLFAVLEQSVPGPVLQFIVQKMKSDLDGGKAAPPKAAIEEVE